MGAANQAVIVETNYMFFPTRSTYLQHYILRQFIVRMCPHSIRGTAGVVEMIWVMNDQMVKYKWIARHE